MDKGMTGIRILVLLLASFWLTCFCVSVQAQIYKIVDKDGNVTYTDQAPGDGTQPMELPELSVVSTDYASLQDGQADASGEEGADEELTRRDLRRMYNDFRISRPVQEETFWGTENTVVMAWETDQPLQPDMSVQFTVDGQAQPVSEDNMMAKTFDRGEHTVSASLMDARGRVLVTSETVRFFVHQASAGGNGP